MLLRTKVSRAFFVVLCLLLVGPIALWYWGPGRYFYPTDWYFWTTEQGDQRVDIRSPTRRILIDWAILPNRVVASAYDAAQAAYISRYSKFDKARGERVSVSWMEYRAVPLYNTGNLEGEQWDLATSYFKSHVDERYNETYSRIVGDVMTYILAAFGIWCLLLLAWRLYGWVAAGSP